VQKHIEGDQVAGVSYALYRVPSLLVMILSVLFLRRRDTLVENHEFLTPHSYSCRKWGIL